MTKNPRKPLSLRIKFLFMLVAALALAVLLWWLTCILGEAAIENIYMSEAAQEERAAALLDDFEEYVRSVNLSVRQAKEISRWAKHQNRVNLKISDEDEIVVDSGWWDSNDYYSAFEFEEEYEAQEHTEEEGGRGIFDGDAEQEQDAEYADSRMKLAIEEDAFTRKIRFSDGVYYVTVLEYSELSLYNTVTISSYAMAIAGYMALLLLYHQHIIKHIIRLSGEVESIAHGNLNGAITMRRRDEMGILAEDVDVMRTSIMQQMRAEQEAWNANSELITRMSHDIRTPLTVLLGFLELLDEGHYSEDEGYQSYLNICKENAYQLKELADKLFQYFLVFGHKMYEMNPEVVDARMMLSQLVGEHVMLLQERDWEIRDRPLTESVPIKVDAVYLKRLFDNLFSNIEKYADPDRPVEISQRVESGQIHIILKNDIRPDPNPVESTNIGLKTCERIVELMGGTFRTAKEKTAFLAELWLPIYREK